MQHVSPADVREVAHPGNAIVMRALVRAPEHGSYLSLTMVRLDERHKRLRTDRATRG